VASDPQTNVDFYQHILGQRLVKTTVNFDDPGTYHFYFGDAIGTPGTIMTYFPWHHMKRGRLGNGETAATAYAISPDSVGYWQARLSKFGFAIGDRVNRFGAEVISIQDADGLQLELIVSDLPAAFRLWEDGPIPETHALRGFHSVTLWLDEVEATAQVLTDQLGYQYVGQEDNRYRYHSNPDSLGQYVDLLHRPGQSKGVFGAGSIHHIAFRSADDAEQLAYKQLLSANGLLVTDVRDRQYFHSIYFRTPGGVLFEIATDAPGFLIDEPFETLGQSLKLPPWLERQRSHIEQLLPGLRFKPVVKFADTVTSDS
jgi:glyoxalase family protein